MSQHRNDQTWRLVVPQVDSIACSNLSYRRQLSHQLKNLITKTYWEPASKRLEEPGRVLCEQVLVSGDPSAREVDLDVRKRRIVEEVKVLHTAKVVSMVIAEDNLHATDICCVASSALVDLRLMIQV